MLFVVLLVIPAAFGIEPACNIIQDLAPNRDLMDPGGSSFDITKFKNNKPKTNELLRIAFYIDERNPWISFGVYKYSVKRYDEEWELLEQRFDVARTCDFAIQKDHGLRRQIEVELVVNKDGRFSMIVYNHENSSEGFVLSCINRRYTLIPSEVKVSYSNDIEGVRTSFDCSMCFY